MSKDIAALFPVFLGQNIQRIPSAAPLPMGIAGKSQVCITDQIAHIAGDSFAILKMQQGSNPVGLHLVAAVFGLQMKQTGSFIVLY